MDINWSITEKNQSFDNNLAPNMTNLVNDRVSLKFNNLVLVQKNSSSFYSNFILNLYIVYGLNNWPRNLTKFFLLKTCLFGTIKLAGNTIKSNFIYNG